MPTRYIRETQLIFKSLKFRPAIALRKALKEGYGIKDFRADLMASLVVAMVALPLSMALAIASGVAPQYGLYTAIIAGSITPLLGGSRWQITGPTAAFVVVLVPISVKYGLAGLLMSGLMAGFILILMGVSGMGQLIRFIPHTVVTGFTTGIGLVIGIIQLKDFLGLNFDHMPETFYDRIFTMARSFPTFSTIDFIIGFITLCGLVFWPRFNKKIPAPLAVLSLVAIAVTLFRQYFPDIHVHTIENRFVSMFNGQEVRGIPPTMPKIVFPWLFEGAHGQHFQLTYASIKALVPPAFAIAMLGAIESLLSAVVADGMKQTHHDPDAELTALGIANIICPFFGGIAATGAISRTATNIRYGGRSPLSSALHTVWIFLVLWLCAPWVSYLPMAALAALVMLVAYHMADFRHFYHIVRVAPKSDVVVLLTCFGLTIVFDMVIGVTVGIILAALLFMERMASLTSAKPILEGEAIGLKEPLPKEILLYQIAGPLFFGAAHKTVDTINVIRDDIRVVVFDLEDVPTMDVTGLVAFEMTLTNLFTHNKRVILTGVHEQPRKLLQKAHLLDKADKISLTKSVQEGINMAKSFIQTKTA